MRLRLVSTLSLALCIAACGGADVAVPDADFEPQAWELAYGPGDMTAWREGTLNRAAPPEGSDPGGLRPGEGVTLDLLATRPDGRLPMQVIDSTTIGPDGKFRLGPGPERNWVLRARLPGHAEAVGGNAPLLPGVLALPAGEVMLGVRPAWPLEVQVVGKDGSPAPGVRVRAEGAAYMQDATSDASGIARFAAPQGGVRVTSLDPSRGLVTEFAELPRAPGAGPVELRAELAPPVVGRAIDADTGRALEDAVVLRLDDPTVRTRTDSEGRFSLVTEIGGRVAAFARGFGWRSAWIRPGEDIELRLSPALVVRGRVIDVDGRPVAGARVLASATMPDNVTERVWGPVTGADGTFVFDWVPTTASGVGPPVLVAHRRGLGLSAGVTVDETAAASDVTLQLGGEHAIEGAVSRKSGALEADVPIEVEFSAPGLSQRQASVLGLPMIVQTTVGLDGRYRVGAVPANFAGVVRFNVAGAEFEMAVEPGVDDAQVRLDLDDSRVIAGRIVDVAGEPVTKGGWVLVDLMNHPRYARLTRTVPLDPDGTFRFEDLPDGTFGVRARVRGYDVSGAVAQAGVEGLELVAEIPAPLDFEVRFPAGVDPGRVLIRLHEADDPAARVRTETIEAGAEELRASLPLVRRGRYHIYAMSGPYWIRMHDVEVPDGFRPPVVLELEKTREVNLGVQDADGSPRSGSRVRVSRVGEVGSIAETFWSGEGGVARVSGLIPGGEYVARAVEDGRPIAETRFVVPLDGDVGPLTLEFPPFGSLIAYVDPEVRADGSAVLEIRRADGSPCFVNGPGAIEKVSRFRIPSAGELRLTGVEVGSVELILTVDGKERARRKAEVVVGTETPVRLR